MDSLETINRPLLNKEEFLKRIVAVAKQRNNVIPATLVRAYARDRYEGDFDHDLLNAVRAACSKEGCFVDNDLGLEKNINEAYHEDVRHYTNKLLDLMEQGIVDPKWLATSLMEYISEDDVAEMAHYDDYFDVDEIESPYNVRQATNHFIELMDQEAVDAKDLARNILLYMSEDNVAEFCHDYEFDDEEETEEEIPEETAECGLCKEEFPLSDLTKEKDFGYLCDGCLRTLESRGEEVDLEDKPLEECSEPEVSVKEKNAKFRKHSI